MKFILRKTSESKPIGWVDIETIDELMALIKREGHSVIVSDKWVDIKTNEYHNRTIEVYDDWRE